MLRKQYQKIYHGMSVVKGKIYTKFYLILILNNNVDLLCQYCVIGTV